MLVASVILPTWRVRGAEGNPEVVTISIVENASVLCDKGYDPPVVTIPVGTTIVWTNNDLVTHTLVSAEGEYSCQLTPLPFESRVIDGGQIFQGMSYQQTFNRPGVYPFMCHLPMHRMQGKIIVEP